MTKTPVAATLALLLPLLGCGSGTPYAVLPRDATIGVGDPTRAAVIASAFSFATPGSWPAIRRRRQSPRPRWNIWPARSRPGRAGSTSTRRSAWS
ncbi:hypothetical protein ACFQY5_29830 [Paeniroseomonas aquatica]|uniref:hypothetical protein n=1 Tax=Paeniroseomonas aquatica TaxID=373043 RepID=UPI0036194861